MEVGVHWVRFEVAMACRSDRYCEQVGFWARQPTSQTARRSSQQRIPNQVDFNIATANSQQAHRTDSN